MEAVTPSANTTPLNTIQFQSSDRRGCEADTRGAAPVTPPSRQRQPSGHEHQVVSASKGVLVSAPNFPPPPGARLHPPRKAQRANLGEPPLYLDLLWH